MHGKPSEEVQPGIIDPIGRVIRKLRVSLVDACNFRCFYCMPDDPKFLDYKKLLSAEELEAIVGELVRRGIQEVRLTGGEPTVRRDFKNILIRFAKLPIHKLGLTSNGFYLERFIPNLIDAKCHHINISLDSLKSEKFNKIVRLKAFDQVMSAILASRDAGLHTKINVVLTGGVNDDEILDFCEFAAKEDVEVRFLELMRIGQVADKENHSLVSHEHILKTIATKHSYRPMTVARDSTAKMYLLSNGARIGVIASETVPFCGNCSRWRLTADGKLRACLMSEAGVNLKGVGFEDYGELLDKVLKLKPTGRILSVAQNMHEIGG